ncbi:MAG TPA: C40 family peptidase [Steroidobacteraceae bacterium]|nr:C40 family peptidase [Steroidobacteraceae bacterium]
MLQRHAVVRTGLMSLPLMFGACSVNPYRPTQPIERTVSVPTAETAPPMAPPVPDDLASSPIVAPPTPATAAPSDMFILERVALTAQRMIGIPYHYGGKTPRGFDCSGLVFYAYREVGVLVPRTAGEQLRASHPINVEQALPGDLVFFRTSKRASHVGIYLGGQSFIHAPSTGRAVVIERLDDEYYLRHRIQIRRLDALK